MFRVRCHRGSVHPDVFRRGFLGWIIVILNYLRWQLERINSRLVLRFFAKYDLASRMELSTLRQLLEYRDQQEDLERLRTSPGFPESAVSPVTTEEDAELGSNYAAKAWASRLNDVVGDARPISLNNLIARYTSPQRQRRYGVPTIVYEDEFEPVTSEVGAEKTR